MQCQLFLQNTQAEMKFLKITSEHRTGNLKSSGYERKTQINQKTSSKRWSLDIWTKELKEVCLLDQAYVKAEDGKQAVGKYNRTGC